MIIGYVVLPNVFRIAEKANFFGWFHFYNLRLLDIVPPETLKFPKRRKLPTNYGDHRFWSTFTRAPNPMKQLTLNRPNQHPKN